MIYTENDHETVLFLRERAGWENPPFTVTVTNRDVAERFGLTISGGAARLSRLERLGVAEFTYEPTEGGQIVRRITIDFIPWPVIDNGDGTVTPAPVNWEKEEIAKALGASVVRDSSDPTIM